MIKHVKLYIILLTAFFIIDMIWLGLVARSFYQKYLGFLMASNPNWFVAILFYLIYIVGIMFFVVVPGLERNSLKDTLGRAALFGFVTYATYDLTNLATLNNWPVLLSVVDMIWGTFLCVSVSAVGFMGGKRIRYG